MCDLSERALLFRCMVAGFCWHFCNFSGLCKVFSQTSLHFVSQFRNLKAILKLGGDFVAISKLGDDFAAISKLGDHFIAIWKFENHLVAKGHFRSTWRIWQGVVMGLRNHFASKLDFRSWVPFSQPISQLRNEGTVLRNGTRVPKGCFTAAKHLAKWGFGCEIPAQLARFIFKRP